MRPDIFLSLVLPFGCVGLLASACSGAETQDVLLKPASSSGGSGSASGDASPGPSIPADCPLEEEPNDSKATANVLAPARCGTLSRTDKKDFVTFELLPPTKTMTINFTGGIRLRVDVAGRSTVELTSDNAGVVPFVMGERYMIEVTALSDTGADVPWRVAVVEK